MKNRSTNWPNIYPRTYASGTTVWVADCGVQNGKRVRPTFDTREEAEAYGVRMRAARAQEGELAFTVSIELRLEASKCVALLAPYNATLSDATTYYITNHLVYRVAPPTHDVTTQLIDDKRRAGRRDRTIRALQVFFDLFNERFGDRQLHTVTLAELSALCLAPNIKPRTQLNRIRLAKQLYNYALKKTWVAENLAKGIEVPVWDPSEPGILTVDEARRLLEHADAFGLLPYVAIALFAGVRCAELLRLEWSAVNRADRELIVGANVSKIRARRVLPYGDTLAAWLALCPPTTGPIVAVRGFEGKFLAMRKAAGIEDWPHNALRHSFASYHLAQFKDPVRTAYLMGHKGGTDMLDRHYKSLVSTAAAAEYWALRPR